MAVQIVGGIRMTSVAITLAEWAAGITPGPDDEELAHRSLLDTVALGLPAERIAAAMALAVPAAGGVQRAFGTDAKSLQVGFAVDAGIRAARLAAAGAQADPASWTWDNAAEILRRFVPAAPGEGSRHG
jgi:hypothetical protein